MKKIAFDFDGVFTELDERHASFAEGIDEKENRTLLEGILKSEAWREHTKSMIPMEGVQRFNNIAKDNEVCIVSRRLEGDRELLLEWLEKHGIDIPSERIHLRKILDTTEIDHKKKYALECDIYYDDRKRVVEQIPNAQLFTSWEAIEE